MRDPDATLMLGSRAAWCRLTTWWHDPARPPWWWKPWLTPWHAANAWWHRPRPVTTRTRKDHHDT